ncbi:MAG: hypothetical protein P1V97_19465, partial [Planctomycetota bacterium]|nr:hypothetical protein [Planctomycetota bacterium]
MLAINDLMCGKLVVQMNLATSDQVRDVLREIDKDFDSAFDFPNHLHHNKLIDEDQVRRLRSFVALYNYVRNESLYLRVIERKKLVTRNFIQRLVALLEAEWYRRRVGDVLLALDQIRPDEDKKTQAKVIRQVDVQDRKILGRYREEDFAGVAKPLIPGKRVTVKSFRISSIFRGKQTRTFVKKHLKEHENVAQSIEQALTAEFSASPQNAGFGDFGDLWALPDDILLESGPDLKAEKEKPAKKPAIDRKVSVLLPPRVRASDEGFAPTMKFETAKIEVKKSYIDKYLIVSGPRFAAMGQAFYRVRKGEEGPHYTLQSIDPRVAPAREV